MLPQDESSAQAAPAADCFASLVEAFRASGSLARSRHLKRLFEFLVLCYREARVPKEIEVALEGLGRGEGFDVSQDALVRVYVHKLRRKLDEFFAPSAAAGQPRLHIPKGEYRLQVLAAEVPAALPESPDPAPSQGLRHWRTLGRSYRLSLSVAGLLLLSLVFWLQAVPPWARVFPADKPLLIVLGDYYQFAEADRQERIVRLVRDFDINSPLDLANHLGLHPEKAASQFDIGSSYLPSSIAQALFRLLPALEVAGRRPLAIKLASELAPENIRDHHILYLGHLSALGALEPVVFAQSRFRPGASYDELIEVASGRRHVTESGLPGPHKSDSRHLAYLSRFMGPNGNRFLIVAGFRDAGLQELANFLAGSGGTAVLGQAAGEERVEVLYETTQTGPARTPLKMVETEVFESKVLNLKN